MKKKAKKASIRPVVRFVIWAVVFLGLLAAADQTLLRLSLDQPLLRDFQDCYRSFRSRLLGRADPVMPKSPPPKIGGKKLPPKSVEAVIEQAAKPPRKQAGSYLYVDSQGALQFADSLEEVPRAYRGSAQPMAE